MDEREMEGGKGQIDLGGGSKVGMMSLAKGPVLCYNILCPFSQKHLSHQVRLLPAEHLSCQHNRTELEGLSHQGVELLCLFSWKGHEPLEHMVVWKVALNRSGNILLVHGQENQAVEQDTTFRGRTELQAAWFSKRNATLRLHGLSPEEEGTYTCHITTMNPFNTVMCAEVTLTVQPGPEPDSRSDENEDGSSLTVGNSDRMENWEEELTLRPRHSSGIRNGPHLLLIVCMPASLLRYVHSLRTFSDWSCG
ncbi:uncharacterized protein [Hemitrygon akajei]|uniref:uncharacterized protein isoform X1 n=1 Tax=Hemitrygon akajei TaxID=2704970 RepID=UPI003BF9D346